MSNTLNGFIDYTCESFHVVPVPKFFLSILFFFVFFNFSLNRDIKKIVGL